MSFSTTPLNDSEKHMQKALNPDIYAPGSRTRRLIQIMGIEIQALRDAISGVNDQMFARLASFGLSELEAEYGLIAQSTDSIGQRQDRLVSKMRTLGVADLRAIAASASSASYSSVDVMPDFRAWTIVLQFTSSRGVPSNLTDLQTSVRSRVPMPYRIVYLFRYLTYGELKAAGSTYGHLKALGLTYGALRTWVPV